MLGSDLFQAWRAGPLNTAEKVRMEFSGLPEPPWHERLGDTVRKGSGPQLFLTSLLGLALIGALVYSLFRAVPASRLRAVTLTSSGASHGPQAEECLRQLAELDDALERGEIGTDQYADERAPLKAALLRAWASENSQ